MFLLGYVAALEDSVAFLKTPNALLISLLLVINPVAFGLVLLFCGPFWSAGRLVVLYSIVIANNESSCSGSNVDDASSGSCNGSSNGVQ